MMKLFIVGIAFLFFTPSIFGWRESKIERTRFRPNPDGPPVSPIIPVVEENEIPRFSALYGSKQSKTKFRPNPHGPPVSRAIPIVEENGIPFGWQKKQLQHKRFHPNSFGPPVGLGIPIIEETVFAWRPNSFGPPRRADQPIVEEGDEDEGFFANRMKKWYHQKTKQQLFEYGLQPVNLLPQTPNNFYYYVVQNFFMQKPSSDNTKTEMLCFENEDCKKPNHHCYKGVCKLQTHRPHKCKVDRDCHIKAPKGLHFSVQIYCDHGKCKLGHRQNPEQQVCTHYSQCINGGECRNGRCQEPEGRKTTQKSPIILPPVTEAPATTCRESKDCKDSQYCENGICQQYRNPLFPPFPYPHHCKADRDCRFHLPKHAVSFIPVYCEKSQCHLGIRNPKVPTTTETPEQQVCLHDFECINGGKCIEKRCVAPELSPTTSKPIETCRVNSDCKKRFYICQMGVCTFKPYRPKPFHCKEDSDCQVTLPNGLLLPVPVYCDYGQCRSGLRPNSDAQSCLHDSHCPAGKLCYENYCVHPLLPPISTPKPPQPHPQHCKVDRDCTFKVPIGTILTIPVYCDNGHCNLGVRNPRPTQAIQTTTQHPTTNTCKKDSDCHGPCNCFKDRCLCFGLITPTQKSPQHCEANSDCYQHGVVCGGGRYCEDRHCLTRHFSIPLPLLIAATHKPCNDDSGCYAHTMLCGVSYYCEDRHCLPVQLPLQLSTESPVIQTNATLSPLPTTKVQPQCHHDRDCHRRHRGTRDPLFGGPRYCDHGVCIRGIRPVVHTTPKPAKTCQRDRDCSGYRGSRHPIFHVPRYCDNGVCKDGHRPVVQTTLKPTKTCQQDSDCMPKDLIKPWLWPSHYCEDNVCVRGHRQDTITTTQETPAEPTSAISVETTKQPKKHCLTDHDCFPHEMIKMMSWLPHHCENNVCVPGFRPKAPTTQQTPSDQTTSAVALETTQNPEKKCKTDQDCFPHGALGRIPLYLFPHYCENSVCVPGVRPQQLATTEETTTEPSTHKPTKRPGKHCLQDSDCKRHPTKPVRPRPQHCENNVCVPGRRPKTRTTQKTPEEHTTVATIKTTKHPKHHCQTDHDCLQHSVNKTIHRHPHYCENHVCVPGRRPKITTATQKTPLVHTTNAVTHKSTKHPRHQCKKDSDCLKHIEFQHKMLVSVFCYEGYCTLHKKPTKPTKPTKSPVEPTVIIPLLKTTDIPAVETSTAVDYHFPATCKADRECTNPIGPNGEEPVNYIPAYCEDNRCKLGTRNPTEDTTTTKPVEVATTEAHRQNEPTSGPLITVEPTELHTTKKPHHPNHCKHDLDCQSFIKPGIMPIRCVHGKCVAGHKNTTSKPKTPKPDHHTTEHKPTHTTIHHSRDVTPKPTAHIYTCRRNRDCKDFPHPKNMPVYCEHRLCKHGHRRPKNDFDSCKSNEDCKEGEGPCVDGFCSRPHHH